MTKKDGAIFMGNITESYNGVKKMTPQAVSQRVEEEKRKKEAEERKRQEKQKEGMVPKNGSK